MGGENFPVGREMVGKGDTSCRGPGWKGGQVTFVTVFFVEFWIQFLQVSQICFFRLALLPAYSIDISQDYCLTPSVEMVSFECAGM